MTNVTPIRPDVRRHERYRDGRLETYDEITGLWIPAEGNDETPDFVVVLMADILRGQSLHWTVDEARLAAKKLKLRRGRSTSIGILDMNTGEILEVV